ncbi:alpha/beta-Hydrolases superfamily protein [Euphorbia peplus]|nr:alpha/beta-Hydrolases superfamily protein [Euphorbia peplus]
MATPDEPKLTAPYGSWKSLVTTDIVSGTSKRLQGTSIDSHVRLFLLEYCLTQARLSNLCCVSDASPVLLTPDSGSPVISYADGVFYSRLNRFVAGREDQRESSTNSTTVIVSISLNADKIKGKSLIVLL